LNVNCLPLGVLPPEISKLLAYLNEDLILRGRASIYLFIYL